MKAVRLNELGGPENLHVEEIPRPVAGEGEILVRVHRAAFNRRDVFITQNLYPGIVLPRTLGSDGSGDVAELGEGVGGHAIGDPIVIDPEFSWKTGESFPAAGSAILGMPKDGTFAEFVVVPASSVYPKPTSLSYDEAAAIPLAGLTAYRAAFTRGRLVKDDVVFVPGVGSGVQTFVLLYAKHVGARTIVTSGSDEKLARAKALGADVTINYKTDVDWHKTVRKAADGIGPSLTVDSTGGDTFAKCLDIARPGGRVVTYGGTRGDSKIRPFSIFWKHLDVLGTSMGSPDDFRAMLALFEGGLRPAVDRIYAMADVAEAAAHVLAGEQFGKVVLAIS
ncbi:MAG: zinc-binding dehydrogenase [Candidatus Eremiobacteraeota bacterium]|nr:zinc-binding dehydrogenase [Candidatus Eremiobacteraeota bacterium]